MESTVIRTTDAKGRVTLYKSFARSPVIVEWVSDSEVRIRKAVVVPEEEMRFYEDVAAPLSDPLRDRFLELLDNPPRANGVLRTAAQAVTCDADLAD